MTKYALIYVLLMGSSYAVSMYDSANDASKVTMELNTEHQYEVEYIDWVKITDKDTGETGWAKRSELNDFFSNGTTVHKTHYQSHNGRSTYSEKICYKPREKVDPEKVKKKQQIMQDIYDEHIQSLERRAKLQKMLNEI